MIKIDNPINEVKKYIGTIYFYDYQKYKQIASGSVFFYKNKWVIVTAAHCIFDLLEKRYSSKIHFLIGKKDILVKKAYIHRLWVEKEYLELDVAFLLPENDSEFINLDRQFINPMFIKPNTSFCYVGGRGLMPGNSRLINRKIVRDDIYKSSLLGIKTHFYNGMSGGPWYFYQNNKLFLFATSSLSFKSVKNKLWAVSWNNEIKRIINQAISEKKDNDVIEAVL